ncbi:MAG: LiaF-related protein [Bacillota bacterium]|nr:LiaF-related protein [Bacillota bacterium]
MDKSLKIKYAAGLVFVGVVTVGILKVLKEVNDIKRDKDESVIFSGKRIKFDDEVFEDKSYGVMCGGLEIDLSKALPSEEDMDLCVTGRKSGIEIKVPQEWNVKAEGASVRSGVSVMTEYDETDTESPKLFVNYDIKYSGLKIKYSSTDE